MKLTEVQKAKLNAKLEELMKEKLKLEKKFEEEHRINVSAWETYGSELCSGEMIAQEQAIGDAISNLEEDMRQIRDCLSGEINLDEKLSITNRLDEIAKINMRLRTEELDLRIKLRILDKINKILK